MPTQGLALGWEAGAAEKRQKAEERKREDGARRREEMKVAAARRRRREALLRRSIDSLKLLHVQFRSLDGPEALNRRDDEPSRLYLAGE